MPLPPALLAYLAFSDYAVMTVYMLAMIAIGLWFGHKGGNTEDYLLGGRNLPWWAIGMSYVVSLLSTLTMVGVPGEAYTNGVSMAIGTLMLPVFSILGFHLFVRFYFTSHIFTPFDYLERRFDVRIRGLAAGFFWISRAIYMGLVLYSCAIVFTGAAQWPVWFTVLIAGGVGTAYTVVGGFRAVVWTEVVQFVVLAGGVALILIWSVGGVPGGAVGVVEYAFENGRGAPALADPAFYSLSPFVRVTLLGLAFAILNEQLFFNSADQIALQRLLGTSSYRQARRSLYTSAAMLTPLLLMLWFLGLAIFAFYGQRPAESRPTQGDLAMFTFIGSELPAPIPGLIISAMLAAVMSTLESGINSLATVATKDFYVRFFRPDASEKNQVRFSRLMTLLTGVIAIAIGLALDATSDKAGATVLETTMAWLALSVALPPVFLLGMFSRRGRSGDALVMLVVGWGVTAGMLIWYLTSQESRWPLSFMMVGVPGPILALIVGYALSRTHPRIPDGELRNLTYGTLADPSLTPPLPAAAAPLESRA